LGLISMRWKRKLKRGGYCLQLSSLCCWGISTKRNPIVQHISIYLIVGWRTMWVEFSYLDESWDVFAVWVTIMGVDWEPTLRHACASRAQRG
jgi:hypothetical protein